MPRKIIETEKIKHKKIGEGIVKEKDVFADYKHKCKKCGYEKAELMDLGAQYSDENELVMIKCGKCGYTERIEKKTS
jgi:DNA-directed RNA polymerase subunit M/transcription elongation factor TFIIS